MKSTVAARCPDFDPQTVMDSADLQRLPRLVPMALAAASEALRQAGIPAGDGLDQQTSRAIGLVLGTGAGGIDFTLDQAGDYYVNGGRPSLWTITNATHGNLAGELSIRLGLRGPSLCVSTGCASSSDASGLALDLLRSDRPGAPQAMVVVGADAHVRWETLIGMELLRVISTRDFSQDPAGAATASRPFDRSRDGFVLGEGAWALVLEREEFARRRGAAPIGSVLGYGVTCDAFHRVRPDPDMVESVRAMQLAVEAAGLRMADVEVVHYHGTGTQLNDALETHAVKTAFGARAQFLPGYSIKGAIGHPQGACGMAAVVATVGALTAQDERLPMPAPGSDGAARNTGAGSDNPLGPFHPPTINLREADAACDLEYTARQALPTNARIALVNCLAFGAKNSALVVRAGIDPA